MTLKMGAESALVLRLLDHLSYRGTLSFYRPDRLPKACIGRMWTWKIAKGWKWQKPAHINVLELEAVYHAVKWRARSLRVVRKRFLHLVDSLVVLGVVSKGRTSSKRLFPCLHRLNILLLALHAFPVLGWVLTDLNPADEPSPMARAAIVASELRDQRRRLRRALGRLELNLVRKQNVERYATHFTAFMEYVRQVLGHLPRSSSEYDALLSEYLEVLWDSGEPKSIATYSVAALQFYLPQLRKTNSLAVGN